MGRRRVRREAAMTAPRRRGDNENSKGGRGCAPRVGGVAVYCRGIKECAHVILTRPHRGPVAQPEAGPGRTANGQKATGGDSDGVITGCSTAVARLGPRVLQGNEAMAFPGSQSHTWVPGEVATEEEATHALVVRFDTKTRGEELSNAIMEGE
ncbi:hypothetical protein BHE74_00020734 [Ensete ventricosum]|nr:hypothetical protein GW17_00045520 [Ensete ventricosum]RWW71533.1 hypothetical protein BHE74_00020734 [Ensete ventricosum]